MGGEGMWLTLSLSLLYRGVDMGRTEEVLTEDLSTAILGPKSIKLQLIPERRKI
jgi:hypothetical protein